MLRTGYPGVVEFCAVSDSAWTQGVCLHQVSRTFGNTEMVCMWTTSAYVRCWGLDSRDHKSDLDLYIASVFTYTQNLTEFLVHKPGIIHGV